MRENIDRCSIEYPLFIDTSDLELITYVIQTRKTSTMTITTHRKALSCLYVLSQHWVNQRRSPRYVYRCHFSIGKQIGEGIKQPISSNSSPMSMSGTKGKRPRCGR